MKKRLLRIITLLLCFLIIGVSFISCSGRKQLDEPLKFIIANDIHYISPTLLGDGSFFSTPKSATDGKLVHYIPDLLDFSSYATYYFEEVARVQIRESLAQSELTKEEIELLAETFAKINSAYFEGRQLDLTAHSQGIGLWRTHGNSFFTK